MLAGLLALSGTAAGATPPGTAPAGWVPRGTAVSGTAGAAGAPVLRPDTGYVDTIAKGRTRTYAVHLGATRDDSGGDAYPATGYLSAFAVPRPGSRVGFLDGLTLRLSTPAGVLCDSYDARFTGQDATAPVGGVVRRPGAAGGVCEAAGTYLLTVRRVSAASSGDDVWPLDLRYLSEPAVAAGKPSGPTAVPTYDPDDAAPPRGPSRAVDGAPGMDGTGAVLAGTGVYGDRLAPGQTVFYRVPLAWGQRLSVTAGFGSATVTRADGFAADGVRVALFSPARGYVDGQNVSYDGRAVSLGAQTPAIAYLNRLSSDSRLNAAAVAGGYYLEVSVHPAVAGFTAGGVPVTLRVRVSGRAGPGPHYRGDLAAAGFAVPEGARSAVAAPTGSGPATRGRAVRRRDGTARAPLAYGAFGLAAVFAVWPTVWLLRARRARR